MAIIKHRPGYINPNPQPTPARTQAQYLHDIRNVESDFIDKEDLLKDISLTKLLQSDGHKVTKSGTYTKCRCPFHHENTPSFTIYDDKRAKCYGCGWFGDAITYVMSSGKIEFVEAIQWLALKQESLRHPNIVQTAGTYAGGNADKGKKTPEAELKRYIDRLLTDEWMRQRICDRRKEYGGETWNPDTILKLAQEGSLGWAGNALAFIYPRGVKYRRWPEKQFIWESEGPSIWRAHRLKAATHVYLMESETDAISAIDAGVETDESVAVVAISGVNSFLGDWLSYLKRKVVTLAFDNDKAGQDAVQKLLPVFRNAGIEVRLPKFEEVQK